MTTPTLFSPLRLGRYELRHRIAMAPLTRMRASPGSNAPHVLNAEYYGQRATPGGLIIAEATQVVPEGQGYPTTPGIHSPEQIAGWKLVTDAVHAKGGIIFLQLWHVGRISHSSLQPGGKLPVAPSAVAAEGKTMTADWGVAPFETPRPLELSEIPPLIAAYAQAARNAIAAGFDGVEVHGANGYLLEQFLQTRTNKRTDAYGGSVENRARLLLEVVTAVVEAVGADRVGVRLSPYGTANDSGEDDPRPLYDYVVAELAKLGLAYLHVIEPRASGAGKGAPDKEEPTLTTTIYRPLWPGVLIGAGGYTREGAASEVAKGHADIVAFGRHFISTPDLVERVKAGADFNPYNRKTFYGGGAEGYTDYPTLK